MNETAYQRLLRTKSIVSERLQIWQSADGDGQVHLLFHVLPPAEGGEKQRLYSRRYPDSLHARHLALDGTLKKKKQSQGNRKWELRSP